MPDQIKETTWGPIFVSYYPIHDEGKVVGVLGIEFDASHQFEAFKQIRIITPLIAIMASLIATIIAVLSFRRISNPRFKDMANTDYLTNLHNRNAFEIDFENLSTHKHNTGIIITDLNDLKKSMIHMDIVLVMNILKKLLKFLKNMSKKIQFIVLAGMNLSFLFIMMPNSKSKLL